MDHHVHSAITAGLRGRGIECLTAAEDDADRLPDPLLMDRATALGFVVFRQDTDLLAIAVERQRSGVAFSGVIFARQLRITIGQAVRDLELMATLLQPEEMLNRIEYLPL
jgi:hypothetical protein